MPDFAIKLQLFLLQSPDLPISLLQEIVELLELSGQQPNFVLVVSDFHLDRLVFRQRALDFGVSDSEVIELSCLPLEQPVQSLDFLGQTPVGPLCFLQLAFTAFQACDLAFEAAELELQLLVLPDLTAAAILKRLLLLLKKCTLLQLLLDLMVPALPILDLSQPTLENAINAVILYLKVVDLALVVEELVLEIFVLR
jgi:hypothetical protein